MVFWEISAPQPTCLLGLQSCRAKCARRWCRGTMPQTMSCRPTPPTRAARALGSLRRPTTWVRLHTLLCTLPSGHVHAVEAHMANPMPNQPITLCM